MQEQNCFLDSEYFTTQVGNMHTTTSATNNYYDFRPRHKIYIVHADLEYTQKLCWVRENCCGGFQIETTPVQSIIEIVTDKDYMLFQLRWSNH